MYIETSSRNNGNMVFVSFERTDIIQFTKITFHYNRFSTSDVSLRAIGRFRLKLLVVDNIWSTRYNVFKNDRYSISSADWKLVSLNFSIDSYVIKLIYDEIDSTHANMCFSNITITHSVY